MRAFSLGGLALGLFLWQGYAPPIRRASPAATDVIVRSGSASVTLDGTHGTITAIESDGVRLTPSAGLAENFRLVILKPDKFETTVFGKDQAAQIEKRTGDSVSIVWPGPLTDSSGAKYEIRARMDVAAKAGALSFTLHLQNDTPFKVHEAQYPIVGGLSDFGKGDATLWAPTSNPWQKTIDPNFGQATFAYPGQICMSFACIESPSTHKSLYFSSEDTVPRYKLYQFEEHGSRFFGFIRHIPFTPPGKSFDGSPVVLRVVDGDWRAAGQVYRAWFQIAFGIMQPSQCWLRNQSFFLFSMFMLPEGTIEFTYKDIPKWAAAAKACGINSVQISGWHMGGHDNGYPDYVPDPRLGSWKELRDGIRACHKMGMKVYFFVNYGQAMIDSDWFKRELYKYREINANGGDTNDAGWGMGTLWARMGHPKLMAWIDLSFPAFRKIIVDHFVKLAEIGADGVHVDKMFPTGIEYNPNITMSPDTASWTGAIDLTKEVMAACRKVRPDWAMSFECNWDRMLQFTDATWWAGNQVITRQVFPEHAETLGLYDACNFIGVNNAVRDGHIVMVAPLNFCRSMGWPPFRRLGRYIKEVKRIRDSLAQTDFLGAVDGHGGVSMAQPLPSSVQYNVFRNLRDGHRVCILTNSSMSPASATISGFGGGSREVRIYVPFQKVRAVMLPATIQVPAEGLVFVEQSDRRMSVKIGGFNGIGQPASHKPQPTAPINGDFETGDFTGWTADPTWVIANDSRRYYSGWHGRYWAWSGGLGEPATGVLKSKPFRLDKDGISLLISGWNSIAGSGKPRKWNYVSLRLADGTELDRVYAPNTTTFVPAFLDGSGHKGAEVYVEAVDDADQPTYSMLCIDDVRTADLPAYLKTPPPAVPAFDAKTSFKLENARYRLVFSRKNGSLIGIRVKTSGLDLIREPRIGGSYKFALPIPGKERWQTIEANWIYGRDQQLSSFEVVGDAITLNWKGPLKNYLGQPYGVSATETVELGEDGPVFNLTIDDRTSLPVGETYFPIIGGIQGLGSTRTQLRDTEMVRPALNGGIASSDMFRVFNNMSWLGDQGPEQWYSYPEDQPEPWIGFSSDRLGFQVRIGEEGSRKTVIRLELVPSGSGTVREDGNWPRPAELHGMPCGVELSFVDVVGGPARRPYSTTPVLVRFGTTRPNGF